MRRFILIGAILIALQLIAYQSSEAQNFSVEIGSGDTMMPVPGFPPGDDILVPGPAPILFGGAGIEVNGFSYGRHGVFNQPSLLAFSVDGFSIGAAGSAVFTESSIAFGEQNYDVYQSGLMGTNIQIHDGNGMGPGGTAAPLGMFEPQLVPGSIFAPGVDGYDNRMTPGPDIYWTWNSFTGPPGPSASGADILLSPTGGAGGGPYVPLGVPYALAGALGLGTMDVPGVAVDNIDALEVWDTGVMTGVFDAGDFVLFSLDPGSPSLGLYGASPGDILLATSVGTGVFIGEAALGLAAGDNLTALSVIPEPNSALILLVALGAAGLRRRKRM